MTTEPVSVTVLERAVDLRAQYNLKTPDAIHIATGILAGATVFVTRDQAWARAGVLVLQPQDVADSLSGGSETSV